MLLRAMGLLQASALLPAAAAAACCCTRGVHVAAAVAAAVPHPGPGAGEAAQAGGTEPAASSSTQQPQPPQQQQEHDPHQQQPSSSPPQQGRQQQPAVVLSSLHQQYLYQLPGPEQVVPQLPRFRGPRATQQPLPVLEALQLVKASARARFPEAVEAHVRLKVDPRRGDQMVRGAALLPHSLGKPLTIAVFAEGAPAEQAAAAGADIVGSDDLVASILGSKGKDLGFNACLATPDMMPKLVKLGRILGPKGLMPNPKVGTLTDDLASTIAELRQGRLEFKMDRGGIVHAAIGGVGFEADALYANMGAFAAALLAAKPEAIKGGLPRYVRSVTVCSTMGAGVPVDVASLPGAMEAAASAMARLQQR